MQSETQCSGKPADKIDRIIRKKELLNIVGYSDTTVWRMERDSKFPKRIRLGGSACGWFESEIKEWLAELSARRV